MSLLIKIITTCHLINLKNEIRNLQSYLYDKQIAYGDLQPGNLIVSKDGLGLKLITTDGMFVPTQGKKAPELGHSNFQYPEEVRIIFIVFRPP